MEYAHVHKAMVPAGSFMDVCRDANRNGELPKHVDIVRLYYTTRPGERLVNATQANNIDPTETGDLAVAEVDLRNQMGQGKPRERRRRYDRTISRTDA